MGRSHRIAAVLVGLIATGTTLLGQGWPQWRGPARDGTIAAAHAPQVWPASFTRAWALDVGEGYSSPVVANGRAFVHSRRDPDETVTAVDLESGRIAWQHTYAAPFAKNQYAARMAKGPNSTPLVAAGRVFTLGVTGILSAWDTGTGRLLWRKDHSASVDTSKLFCGTAMSPLHDRGLLFVHVGSDLHGGRLLALDPARGTERWTWRGSGPGYASPIAVTVGGIRQIVTMTEGEVVGIAAESGELLWSIPFPDEWHENIVTPLWTGTTLVVSGTRQGTRAFTLERQGGRWRASEAWKNPDVAMYMSTPVYGDGVIYGHSSRRKGQFVALDARTGAIRWATEGREGEHASVLLTPSHVVFLNNAGQLVVVRRSAASFQVERRYEVAASATWAMPVVLPDGLLVRDAVSLARLKPVS